MRVLDLFSGIGGFSIGLERAGMTTVAFCEIEPYCQKVLKKHWPTVPIYSDVRTLTKERLDADGIRVDVICGGFPCQPYSVAGKQLGSEDDRALWPEYRRLVEELRPAWVIGENVVGLVKLGLDDLLADLEGLGYAIRTFDIPACAIGARHQRRRIWIVAHSNDCSGARFGQYGGEILSEQESIRPGGCGESLAHSDGEGLQERFMLSGVSGKTGRYDDGKNIALGGWWATEPDVGRVANGVSGRVDRLRGLGNAVVPQIPELIGRAILKTQHRANDEGRPNEQS